MAGPTIWGPKTTTIAHHRHCVVAVPYPGRGHINPMLNFCKLMASTRPDIYILVIVTEEWLEYLYPDKDNQESATDTICFTTIPNVLPSELVRGADINGFFQSVQRDMEGPVEQVLDKIGAPLDLIIADTCLVWAVDLARRRKVQVASFWTASVSLFLLERYVDLIRNFSAENGEERIEFIPGISSIRILDLPEYVQPSKKQASNSATKIVSSATETQCIIFRSLNELEAPVMDALRTDLSTPVFAIGPAIPYFRLTRKSNGNNEPHYMTWLNSQQERSVLYVSLGSFLSTSSSQMDELAAGLRDSGVPFLWVVRDQACQLSNMLGDKAMVVPWCDQMRVLCHPSIGGFFTHCGWNSTVETAFAGVPALTFPLAAEQNLNGKMMVEDWGIGWRVKDSVDGFVGREAISVLLKKFMDLECRERKDLDAKSKELQARLLVSVEENGSTNDFDEFLSLMF